MASFKPVRLNIGKPATVQLGGPSLIFARHLPRCGGDLAAVRLASCCAQRVSAQPNHGNSPWCRYRQQQYGLPIAPDLKRPQQWHAWTKEEARTRGSLRLATVCDGSMSLCGSALPPSRNQRDSRAAQEVRKLHRACCEQGRSTLRMQLEFFRRRAGTTFSGNIAFVLPVTLAKISYAASADFELKISTLDPQRVKQIRLFHIATSGR